MTEAEQKIRNELDQIFGETVAIAVEDKVIRSWVDIRKRPLHVHREIKAIAKETGDTYDARVALNYILPKLVKLAERQLAIQARANELERALIELTGQK